MSLSHGVAGWEVLHGGWDVSPPLGCPIMMGCSYFGGVSPTWWDVHFHGMLHHWWVVPSWWMSSTWWDVHPHGMFHSLVGCPITVDVLNLVGCPHLGGMSHHSGMSSTWWDVPTLVGCPSPWDAPFIGGMSHHGGMFLLLVGCPQLRGKSIPSEMLDLLVGCPIMVGCSSSTWWDVPKLVTCPSPTGMSHHGGMSPDWWDVPPPLGYPVMVGCSSFGGMSRTW